MVKRIITKRIGEVLIDRGVIKAKELEVALTHQQAHGGLIGQILVHLGFTTEEEVALAVTAQYGFPYLPLDNYDIDPSLTVTIPEAVARALCLVPVDRIGNALTLAMADPSNMKAIEEVELLTKCVVQAFVSTPSAITKAIEQLYTHADDHRAVPPQGHRATPDPDA